MQIRASCASHHRASVEAHLENHPVSDLATRGAHSYKIKYALIRCHVLVPKIHIGIGGPAIEPLAFGWLSGKTCSFRKVCTIAKCLHMLTR